MISVIIPTYNRASFIGEAIRSVLEQDYFLRRPAAHRLELLIIDDGSDDGTAEEVLPFRDRLSYHAFPHRGVSAARNAGLRLSRGEFIAFLDSDDLWKKKKISSQMDFLTARTEAVACYTEEVWFRNGRHLNPCQKHRKFSGWIFDRVLPLCLLSLSSCLFRRRVFEVIGGFDEELPACEDYDFGIRLAQKYPLHLIPKPLIVKRGGHPGQLSHQFWGMDRFRVRALEKALSLDLTEEQRRLVRGELVRKSGILVKGFEKRENLPQALKYRELVSQYGGEDPSGKPSPPGRNQNQ